MPVTSIHASPSVFLLDTGTTRTLTIYDQSDNDITAGCTFVSDNTCVAKVDAAGVVTPVTALKGTFITVKHTASSKTTVVYLTVIKGGRTPMKSDSGGNYANRAALLANCSTSIGGTNSTGTALYTDILSGGSIANIDISTSSPYNGHNTFRLKFPNGGSNPGALYSYLSSGLQITNGWFMRTEYFVPGFTTVGSGGGSSAYKLGPFFGWDGPIGRAGLVYSNTSNLYSEAYTQDGPSITGGVNETLIEAAGAPEWNDSRYYVSIFHYYVTGSGDMAIDVWRKKIGADLTQTGLTASGPMDLGVDPGEIRLLAPFGMNMNQTNTADKYIDIGNWEFINGEIYTDPYGVLSTPSTLANVIPNAIPQGVANINITLEGTGFKNGDVTVFSNTGITVNSTTFINSTELETNISISGSASVGSGTVTAYNSSTGSSNPHAFAVTASSGAPMPPILTNLALYINPAYGCSTSVDNDPISSITDQSLSGIVFSGTGSNRPTFETNMINGLPAINFAGSQYLTTSSPVAALNKQYLTIYALYTRLNDSGTTRVFFSNEDFTNYHGYSLLVDHNDRHRFSWGTGSTIYQMLTAATTAGVFTLFTAELDPNGNNISTNLEGGAYLNRGLEDGVHTLISPQSTYGPTLGTLSSDIGTDTAVGSLAALLIYAGDSDTASHTPTQRTDIWNWFESIWGTPT